MKSFDFVRLRMNLDIRKIEENLLENDVRVQYFSFFMYVHFIQYLYLF